MMCDRVRDDDDDELEKEYDREQKRHRSDVESKEDKKKGDDDVASEEDKKKGDDDVESKEDKKKGDDDDLTEEDDFSPYFNIISDSEMDDMGNPLPRRSPRPVYSSYLEDQGLSDPSIRLDDVLYGVPWEFNDARKSKSIETAQDDSDAYGNGVPNNKMSDAELWKLNFGGRMPVPGEDLFKEGIGPLPDTLVNVQKPGEDSFVGVVREVLPDGSYKVVMGSDGNGDILTALSNEIKVVPPVESDKVKILGGLNRGDTGKLIQISGSKCYVKFDHPSSVQLFNVKFVAKSVNV